MTGLDRGVEASPLRVDAHQHFWHYRPENCGWITAEKAALRRDFLPRHLEPELRAAGLHVSIAVQASQTIEDTEFLLSMAEAHPFVAGVIGWVDLQADDARAQLARWALHPKLLGVRHVVQDEADDRFLLRPAFCRGVSHLEELGLTYDILIYPRHLDVAAEFVAQFPHQSFVLDHLAKPDIRAGDIRRWEPGVRKLAAHPRVYAKLSGLVTEASWSGWTAEQIHPYLDVAFDCFGADRLMIGSDWPVCTLAAAYGETMAVVTDYLRGRSEVERAAVLGGTARRFWNLPARAGEGDAR